MERGNEGSHAHATRTISWCSPGSVVIAQFYYAIKEFGISFSESESANYSTPTHNKLLHCKLLWGKP